MEKAEFEKLIEDQFFKLSLFHFFPAHLSYAPACGLCNLEGTMRVKPDARPARFPVGVHEKSDVGSSKGAR